MDFVKLQRFKANALEIVCKVSEWAEIFKVDPEEIERQIGYAHGWADNNPKRAPKVNVVRYLYNWMLIAQRQGSMRQRKVKDFEEHRAKDDDIMTGDDFRRMREAIKTGMREVRK